MAWGLGVSVGATDLTAPAPSFPVVAPRMHYAVARLWTRRMDGP